MIYELRYTAEYKKQFNSFKSLKKDILKVHNVLTVNPFTGKYKRINDNNFSNFYCTEFGKVRIFWKVVKNNVIILAGISKK